MRLASFDDENIVIPSSYRGRPVIHIGIFYDSDFFKRAIEWGFKPSLEFLNNSEQLLNDESLYDLIIENLNFIVLRLSIPGEDENKNITIIKKFNKPQTEGVKGYVCSICGWVYEGSELPSDIVCPLCKHGASEFVKIED